MCANYLSGKIFNISTTCACDNTNFRFTSYTDDMNILKNYHKCNGKKHLSKNKNNIHIYQWNPHNKNRGITTIIAYADSHYILKWRTGSGRQATDSSPGQGTDGPAGQVTDGPAGQATDGPAGQVTDGPSGQVTDGPAGQVTDGPAGQVTDGSAGQVTDGPAGQVTDGPAGQATDVEEAGDRRRGGR